MTETFGTLLGRARRNTRDPQRGGALTQERFAELITLELKTNGTLGKTISSWERGRGQPRRHDRAMLCAIVSVLLRFAGLSSFEEANELLSYGGYAPLSQTERNAIAPGASASRAEVAGSEATPDGGAGRTLIAIRHQSMERIPQRAIAAALPRELRSWELLEVEIDQCDLFVDGRLANPYEAARRQHDLERQITALLDRHPGAQIAYYGIAHIPLLFLAGYTLSNRRAILQFENDRHTRGWDLLQRGGEAPPLQITGLPDTVTWETGEVVVRVSVSFRVAQAAVVDVIGAPLASVELGLERPALDSISSAGQLRAYGQAFRQTMDLIQERLPRARGIHIFYAGPPSLAFLCGQLVSKTIHPRLVVYNFVGKDRPQYSWGLDLTHGIDAPDFLVRPSAPETVATSTQPPARYTVLPISAT
jgi:hypothetical protein